ncbi:protein kinase domain protein, partial [Ichthyophthirius multifiliis]
KNNDGVLTLEEISNALTKQENQQLKEIESVINSLDSDGNGTINYTEFLAASIEKSLYLKEERLLQAFKMFDQDGSGKISKQELKNVLGDQEEYKNQDDNIWDQMIQEADKNGDGEIDFYEFVEMMNTKEKQ